MHQQILSTPQQLNNADSLSRSADEALSAPSVLLGPNIWGTEERSSNGGSLPVFRKRRSIV